MLYVHSEVFVNKDRICLDPEKSIVALKMDLENESPTTGPREESAPQEFFEVRGKILEIVRTVLETKDAQKKTAAS